MKSAQHITKAKGAYANPHSVGGKRRRGNPNWGKPLELGSLPVVICQFDQKLEELKLPSWESAKIPAQVIAAPSRRLAPALV